MKNRVKTISIVALLFVTLAVAADSQVDFSGKWALEKSEENFNPTAPMKTTGPVSAPMGGNSADVRTGGDGSYRGGEGQLPSGLESSAPDLVIAITQTETEIKFERRWTQAGRRLISHESFTLDGKDNIVRDSAGNIETKSKAKWRKGGLTIESVHQVPAGGRTVEVRVRQEFSLSKDGQVLSIKETQEIPSGQVVIRQTYKKS